MNQPFAMNQGSSVGGSGEDQARQLDAQATIAKLQAEMALLNARQRSQQQQQDGSGSEQEQTALLRSIDGGIREIRGMLAQISFQQARVDE